MLSLWAFVLDPQSAIWNQRLIPFWFITIHLSSGWLVGYMASRWARYVPRRRRWIGVRLDGLDETVASTTPTPGVTFDDLDAPEATRELVALASRRLYWATCAVAVLRVSLSTVPGLITPVANELHLDPPATRSRPGRSTTTRATRPRPRGPSTTT